MQELEALDEETLDGELRRWRLVSDTDFLLQQLNFSQKVRLLAECQAGSPDLAGRLAIGWLRPGFNAD